MLNNIFYKEEGDCIERFLEKLKGLYEAMCVVETKGISTIIMGNCLVGMREMIESYEKTKDQINQPSKIQKE